MRALARLKRRWSSDDGFSLIELVGAVGILLVVVMGVMSAMTYASQTAQDTGKRDRALAIANQRLEEARNLPYDNVGVQYASGGYGDPPGSILTPDSVEGYTVNTVASWMRDNTSGRAQCKRIMVTVGWATPRTGQVQLSTIVYGKTNLVNTGDLMIQALDADTALPIQGATAHLTPTAGSDRYQSTDVSGSAFFGMVQAGPCTLDVSMTGYIFDLSTVATAAVVPDSLTNLIVFGQQPSRGVVHVLRTNGGGLQGAGVSIHNSHGGSVWRPTDANGDAVFEGLLKDNYSVEVTASGYPGGMSSFAITVGNQTVQTTVTMADASTMRVLVAAGGVPLVGATVQAHGPSPSVNDAAGSPAITGSTGQVSFTPLAAGTYQVTGSYAGYISQTQSFELSAGVLQDLTISLTPVQLGTLQVQVLKANGQAKSGCRIFLYQPANTPYTYQNSSYSTGSNGWVTISNLPAGTYYVRAYSLASDTKTTVVPANGTTTVQVRLQ